MAGHGSPPAEDKANHPNRKVGREGISTQPRPLGKPDKYRPEPMMVQRVRRARPGGTQHPQRGYD
jgi:hypothetical protein